MKTIRYCIFLFCFFAVAKAGFAQGQSDSMKHLPQQTLFAADHYTPSSFWNHLPTPRMYVNDYEQVFSAPEIASLDSVILAYELKTTRQIALITLDSTRTTADSLDALTMRIANVWGVGQKDKNNGVTIAVSKYFKKMRIVNGYGIVPLLSDDETAELINSVFIPYFKAGKYFEGCYYGLVTLMNTVDDHEKRKK
jgi:uncharacterized protein